jgi:DNA recombination-dependent growth factor C
MNNLIEAVNHIQKAISLLGEDLVTLTRSSIDSLPAVALSEELLKLHSVVSNLGSL